MRGNWLVAAAGQPPKEFDLSGKRIIYINTEKSVMTPLVQSMVTNLSLADAIVQAKNLIDLIEDALPELKATGGKFLAGQSGETIAELRQPAENKLALARANYEHSLVKAQQIALSLGVLYGLWDVGTGAGTWQAAEAAYKSGAEARSFNQRPFLPQTEQEKLTTAMQRKTLGFSQESIFEGLGVKDIAAEMGRKAKETEASQQQFARAFDRGETPAADDEEEKETEKV